MAQFDVQVDVSPLWWNRTGSRGLDTSHMDDLELKGEDTRLLPRILILLILLKIHPSQRHYHSFERNTTFSVHNPRCTCSVVYTNTERMTIRARPILNLGSQQNIYTNFQNYSYNYNVNIWATGNRMSGIIRLEIPGVPSPGKTKDISFRSLLICAAAAALGAQKGRKKWEGGQEGGRGEAVCGKRFGFGVNKPLQCGYTPS